MDMNIPVASEINPDFCCERNEKGEKKMNLGHRIYILGRGRMNSTPRPFILIKLWPNDKKSVSLNLCM